MVVHRPAEPRACRVARWPPCPRTTGARGSSTSSATTTCPVRRLLDASDTLFTGWPTYDIPTVRTWHRDGMVLVGDAVHAASPPSGQGASMAFEDARHAGARPPPRPPGGRPTRSPPTSGYAPHARGGRRRPRQARRRRSKAPGPVRPAGCADRVVMPAAGRPACRRAGSDAGTPGSPGTASTGTAPSRPEPGGQAPRPTGQDVPWPGPASFPSPSPSTTAPATRCGRRRGRRTARSGRRSSARPRTTRRARSTSSRPPRRSRRSAGRNTDHDLADHPVWPVVAGLDAADLTPDDDHRYDLDGVYDIAADNPDRWAVEDLAATVDIVTRLAECLDTSDADDELDDADDRGPVRGRRRARRQAGDRLARARRRRVRRPVRRGRLDRRRRHPRRPLGGRRRGALRAPGLDRRRLGHPRGLPVGVARPRTPTTSSTRTSRPTATTGGAAPVRTIARGGRINASPGRGRRGRPRSGSRSASCPSRSSCPRAPG